MSSIFERYLAVKFSAVARASPEAVMRILLSEYKDAKNYIRQVDNADAPGANIFFHRVAPEVALQLHTWAAKAHFIPSGYKQLRALPGDTMRATVFARRTKPWFDRYFAVGIIADGQLGYVRGIQQL
jgi:hypothetical protein